MLGVPNTYTLIMCIHFAKKLRMRMDSLILIKISDLRVTWWSGGTEHDLDMR